MKPEDKGPAASESRKNKGHTQTFDEGGGGDDDVKYAHNISRNVDDGPVLPSTTDLAKSFLQSEPSEEKAELQAALSSKSLLDARNSEDDVESEVDVGLNDGMSLPSFVAGFLKGIRDRLQVRVKDVSLKIDMDLQQNESPRDGSESSRDPVTAMFTIQDIALNNVISPTADEDSSKTGKRLLTLSQIHMLLLSDPEVFSKYSSFTDPTSSSALHSETAQTPTRIPSPSPQPESPEPGSPLALSQSTILDPQTSHDENTRSQVLTGSLYSADGRFSDADENESQSYHDHDLSISGEGAFFDNPGYLEQVLGSQYGENLEHSSILPSGSEERRKASAGGTPRPLSPEAPAQEPTDHLDEEKQDSRPQSEAEYSDDTVNPGENEPEQADVHEEHPASPEMVENRESSTEGIVPSLRSSSSDASSNSGEDGLAESKIFSHEQASSLYMSAMSYKQGATDSFQIPGAWDSPKGSNIPQDADLPSLAAGEPFRLDDTTSTPVNKTRTSSLAGDITEERGFASSDLRDSEANSGAASRIYDTVSSAIETSPKVAKSLVEVSEIAVWLPSLENQVEESGPAEVPSSNSASKNVMNDSVFSLSGSTSHHRSANPLHQHGEDAPWPSAKAIDVEVTKVLVKFDIACGWLTVKMGHNLIVSWTRKDTPANLSNKANGPQTTSSSRNQHREKRKDPKNPAINENTAKTSESRKYPLSPSPFHLHISTCSFEFLEHNHGRAYSSLPVISQEEESNFPAKSIVLHAALSDMDIQYSSIESIDKLRLNLSKFTFGNGSDDIIWFDKESKIRDSVKDLSAPSPGDISLLITMSAEQSVVHLTTLPLRVLLNIRSLEETTNWFGGLSTILELGNSIASMSTIKGEQVDIAPRPRAVHFAPVTPKRPSRPQIEQSHWKLNCRIQGLVVELVGEHCNMKLETTAAKVVSRFQGAGLQIDKGRLSGPYMSHGPKNGGTKVDFSNIRIEYSSTPNEDDLDRLLTLLTPSKDRYDEDDDVMLDTLFKQRDEGAVLRVNVTNIQTELSYPQSLTPLLSLNKDIAKLLSVTKYLPQDDRPGILTLVLVRELSVKVNVGKEIGTLQLTSRDVEVANVSLPSLTAAKVLKVSLVRNNTEELVGEGSSSYYGQKGTGSTPMVMGRFIPEELDPTIRLKLYNLRIEYSVSTLIAFMTYFGVGENATTEELAANMANSIANLGDVNAPPLSSTSSLTPPQANDDKPGIPRLAVVMRDCVIGLSPRQSQAKGLFVLTHAKFAGKLNHEDVSEAKLDIQKASVLIIDDIQNINMASDSHKRTSSHPQSGQVHSLQNIGYIPVCYISSAMAAVKAIQLDDDGQKSLDVELRDDLLVMETCADSTQTLITILNGLSPPAAPSKAAKYRTQIIPIQDMLSSFSGDAFPTPEELLPQPRGSPNSDSPEQGKSADDPADELEYVSDFSPAVFNNYHGPTSDDSLTGSGHLIDSFHSDVHVSSSVEGLNFQDDHFAKKSSIEGTAHRWDSGHNTYGLANDIKLHDSPLRVRVRDVHFIWNLYDGYDWQRTRDTISKAVKDVQSRATERQRFGAGNGGGVASPGPEDEEESVIGDFLFNSIYIGIPANRDPKELSNDINRNIDDLVSETGSYATSTTVTGATSRANHSPVARGKRLHLSRSKHHKMAFELQGISADLVVFPPGAGETQSSVDVRVRDLEIFDHLPTSTWKKFATYMEDSGPREIGTSMIHLEILNVKPVAELAASELVLKVSNAINSFFITCN